jgi:uncharacterized protein (UPF0333 family)
MKAQGSTEYIIIIAAVLAVAAIVVLFLTGVFSGGKMGSTTVTCKAAASRCANEMATSTGVTCDYCNEACAGIPTKIPVCKEGKPKEIF